MEPIDSLCTITKERKWSMSQYGVQINIYCEPIEWGTKQASSLPIIEFKLALVATN